MKYLSIMPALLILLLIFLTACPKSEEASKPSTAPTAIKLSALEIEEGKAIGTVIGDLSAEDADKDESLVFSLASANDKFRVIDNSKLASLVVFDYAENQAVKVKIEVTDKDNLKFEQEFTITIKPIEVVSVKVDDAVSITIDRSEVIAFWKAFEAEDSDAQLKAYFQNSKHVGVNTILTRNFGGQTDPMIKRIKGFTNYYKSIRKQTLNITRASYPKLKEYFTAFKKLYPELNAPKIIFTVAALSVGGTVSDQGLIISAEFYGKNVEGVQTAELGPLTSFLFDIKADFEPLQFHEHMHFEQLKANFEAFVRIQSKPTLLGFILE